MWIVGITKYTPENNPLPGVLELADPVRAANAFQVKLYIAMFASFYKNEVLDFDLEEIDEALQEADRLNSFILLDISEPGLTGYIIIGKASTIEAIPGAKFESGQYPQLHTSLQKSGIPAFSYN